MSNEQLAKKFEKGWKHFCSCIDFGRSHLDSEAIRFMNELPAEIIKALKGAKHEHTHTPIPPERFYP